MVDGSVFVKSQFVHRSHTATPGFGHSVGVHDQVVVAREDQHVCYEIRRANAHSTNSGEDVPAEFFGSEIRSNEEIAAGATQAIRVQAHKFSGVADARLSVEARNQ